MIVQLSDLGGNLADLPPFQRVLLFKDMPMLLLIFPQLGVNIERAAKIRLPLVILVPVLGQLSQAVKQLSTLVQQVNKLGHDLLIVIVSGRHHSRVVVDRAAPVRNTAAQVDEILVRAAAAVHAKRPRFGMLIARYDQRGPLL